MARTPTDDRVHALASDWNRLASAIRNMNQLSDWPPVSTDTGYAAFAEHAAEPLRLAIEAMKRAQEVVDAEHLALDVTRQEVA